MMNSLKKLSKKESFNKMLMGLFSISILFLLFYILYLTQNNTLLFPSPLEVLSYFFNLLGQKSTYLSTLHTLYRLVISLIISIIIGTTLGVFAAFFKKFRAFINPYILLFRTLPLASIIVIIVLLLGIYKAPYVVTCFMLVPVFYEGIYQGIIAIDSNLMDVWKLDSKLNLKVIFKVVLPLSNASFKSSLVQAIGLGFKVLIMGEFISHTKESLGNALMGSSVANVSITPVYAWSLLLVLLASFITFVTNLILHKMEVGKKK